MGAKNQETHNGPGKAKTHTVILKKQQKERRSDDDVDDNDDKKKTNKLCGKDGGGMGRTYG